MWEQQVCRLVELRAIRWPPPWTAAAERALCPAWQSTPVPPDVVIDFSSHAGVGGLVDCCASRGGLPLVAATTGYTPEEFAKLEAGAKKIAIFQSYNMSVGVALLARLVKQAAAIFGGCDVEIVEATTTARSTPPAARP
ncbi:MAG: hypothetical protein ACLUNZ_09970 [Evtepia sp.]